MNFQSMRSLIALCTLDGIALQIMAWIRHPFRFLRKTPAKLSSCSCSPAPSWKLRLSTTVWIFTVAKQWRRLCKRNQHLMASGKNKEAVKLKELVYLFNYLKEKWPCHKTKHPFFHCLPLDKTGYLLWLLPINVHKRNVPLHHTKGTIFIVDPFRNYLSRKATWMGQEWDCFTVFVHHFSTGSFYMLATYVKDINHLEYIICCLSLLRSAFIHSQKKT